MMAINYVTRTSTGSVSRDQVTDGSDVSTIWAGGGQEVSFNLRQMDIQSFVRDGQNLEMTLADGRVILLENYFGSDGEADSRLFLSADGYLNEVALVEGGEGVLYAQYGPTEQWGKWSPSDELIFLDGGEGIVTAGVEGDQDVSMLAAGLLGGTGLFGAGAAGAAGLAATAALVGAGGGGGGIGGGGGSNGQPAYIDPTIDQTNAISIGGDNAGPDQTPITISGTAQPGSEVVVTIGGETVTTTSTDGGTWEAVFEGENFPEDGEYEVTATVTEPNGTATDLTGPGVVIDTTPPDTSVLEGTVNTGEIINAQEYNDGFDIVGTGETGSSIAVTIDGVRHETSVDGSGEWKVTFEPGELETGDYTTQVVVVATDIMGNSSTLIEDIRIDTILNELVVTESLIAGDGVVNGAEASVDGFEVTGTTEANAEVTLQVGNITRTVTANGQGEWVVPFEAGEVSPGTYPAEMTATTTDIAGNETTVFSTLEVDTEVLGYTMQTNPGGADDIINSDEIGDGFAVTGTTEIGSTVVLTLGTSRVEADVDEFGNWSAEFTGAQIGEGTFPASLTAVTTDAAGNSETRTHDFAVDTEAGALTLNTNLIGGDGTVNLDEVKTGVLVTGTADPGAIVTVTLGGVPQIAEADTDGNWRTTYNRADVPGGDYFADVTASTTDVAENVARAEGQVHIDTQIENLSLDDLNVAVGTNGNNVINAQIAAEGFDVTGTIEQGSTVKVTIGDVTRDATVNTDGTWTAEFLPGDITGTEYPADLIVDVKDPADNTDSIDGQVQVDLVVNELSFDTADIEEGAVVNALEAADGVTLTGRAEGGSSVKIEVFGETYFTTANTAGDWSWTIPGEDIPLADQSYQVVVTATDPNGNVSAPLTQMLTVDAITPESPDLVGYFREGGGYRNVTLDTTTDEVDVHQVAPSGAVSELSVFESENAFLGETDYFFVDNGGASQPIPDGSQLVVTSTDTAGNASSTYVVLDETSTNTVDAGNANLSQFQIETIDLRFGDQSELTITEEQILALSDTTDQLVVRGGTDDTVTVTGAQLNGSTQMHGEQFNIYTLGDDATVVVDSDIDVVT